MSGRGGIQGSVRSSLPYQLLLYCHAYYAALYYAAEVLALLYKSSILPFPASSSVLETLILLVLIPLEFFRNSLGQRGNLTESGRLVLGSVALTLPAALAVGYLLLFQTYVLWLELPLNIIHGVALLLETILAIVAMASFSR